MSALAEVREPRPAATGADLRVVPTAQRVLGRTPFLLLLLGILVAGLVGVLLLSTTLQSRAFEVRRLQAEANNLTYLRADLDSQARRLSTTGEIARRAEELGMVPNPYPVYVVLPSGEVRGVPKPVTGDEMPQLDYRSPAEVQTARQQAVAPAPTPATVEPAQPGDSVPAPEPTAAPAEPAATAPGAAPTTGGA